MRVLLDTHAFLWFIANDSQLSGRSRAILEDGENELLLSGASLWEIAIKISIGKLQLGGSFDSFIPQHLAINRIALLDISLQHLTAVSEMPRHHRDPFDRLIIAQAMTEQMPVISIDDKFDLYPIRRVW
ncbi:MAG: type II toxin-antitoxin system VapC family toxin [Blastocatellales bacterium]|nr:type II toxin-antitoxin system VapC family toxin [Blastocatellales bacterium]